MRKMIFLCLIGVAASCLLGGYVVEAPKATGINALESNEEASYIQALESDEELTDIQISESEEPRMFQSIGIFRITGYTSAPFENGGYTVTCLGDDLESNIGAIVAVDKNVIPLNTKLYIEGIGYRIARDTGVIGRTIDVLTGSDDESMSISGNYEVFIVNEEELS